MIPGKNSARYQLDVADLESSEGDENEDLNTNSFGNEEIRYDDQRQRKKKDKTSKEASRFNGNKHEVGERAS